MLDHIFFFTLTISRLFALTSSISCCTFLRSHSETHPSLQFLELLLATFHGQVLSFIKAVLQVLHCHLQVLLHPLQMSTGVSLHLLLDSQGIIPAPDLSIQSSLHGLDHSLAVPLDLFNLFVLLCNLPVNFTLDLGQLKLNAEDLGFLVLQSSL
uniref:Uncharacterized protein n=1 Tax=Maylandia zebra TaxID=106582 RepID=A0A3P9C5Y7_9CICH